MRAHRLLYWRPGYWFRGKWHYCQGINWCTRTTFATSVVTALGSSIGF